MQGLELLGAGIVLVGTVSLGLVAHELTHAMALRVLGVPYDIQWFPDRQQSSRFAGGIRGTWASVTPRYIPARVPTWGIQLSALAPLVLTIPLLLGVSGGLPELRLANSPYFTAMIIAWLACSLPSPQDFSVFWYADVAITEQNDSFLSKD